MRDIPTYTIKDGHGVIPAGKTVTGFPYSSTEATDKFIGQNVSFETFLSAIPNPESKLYQSGHGALGRCNYGIVCNGFVRYILGIPYRVNTQRWHTIEGMHMVFQKDSYKVEDVKLCDILHAFNDGRNHVFVVQLCCGSLGYLPTEKAERAGHYSTYISSGLVGHDGGDMLARVSIKEINEMFM